MATRLGTLLRPVDQRQHPSSNGDWNSIFGGQQTAAGVDVTVDGSLASAVVFACVRVLAESIAMLPLITYRRLPNGGKERAGDHALYSLLHDSPNPEMTAFEWRELVIKHCATWGNHFSEIEWSRGGKVLNLWPLRPDRMSLKRANGGLIYEYWLPDGGRTTLRQDQVLHVRFMGNGLWGESPIRTQMNSIGLDLATEEFGGRYFSNGAKPGIILKHPGHLSAEAADRLQKSWEDSSGGLANAHRTKVLEEGMDVDTVGVPPEEAQFLQTRQFQRSVIAGWFRVPPHLIGDLEQATFSNIEQQALEFVVYSLQPWLVRTEQRLGLSLLSADERRSYYIEHLVDGLLRGDSASRSAYFATAIQNGWMNRNEVRSLENMNPYDGGEDYLMPLNMTTTDQAQLDTMAESDQETDQRSDQSPDRGEFERRADDDPDEAKLLRIAKSRQRLAWSSITLFEDAAGRVVRREVADLRRAMAKAQASGDWAEFLQWLDGFYDDVREWMPGYFRAALTAMAGHAANHAADELGVDAPELNTEAFIEGYLTNQATGYVSEHHNYLQALIQVEDEEERATELTNQFDRWVKKEPALRGHDQAISATNSLARVAYVALGVKFLRWMAVGDSCPFCQRLDGQIVGIDHYFVDKGGTVTGAGGEVFNSGKRRRHGPLHDGCDCVVVAG